MKHFISAALAAVLLLSCINEEIIGVASQESQIETNAAGDSGAFIPGKACVYVSEEMAALIEEDLEAGAVRTRSSGLNLVMDNLYITDMRRVFPHAGEYEERTRREGLHRWYIVTYSTEIARTKAEESFMSLDGIEYIEPVRRVRINDVTENYNDFTNYSLWGLNNTTNPAYDINVIPVWENYTTGDPKVIVSVVDSGVETTHEDLVANCKGLPHKNFLGSARLEAGEHGTHVAGTIAAVGNNGKGIVGIAGGTPDKPGVRILSSQIFNPDGSIPEDVDIMYSANAIKYGADNGAVISQNSWGYIYDTLEDAKKATIMATDQAAIDYFIQYAGCDNKGRQLPDSPMRGGVVIFAAGNDAYPNGAPANYPPVIAVGAIDENGNRADFSNYGDWVDIAAPGTTIWSTIPNNGYMWKKGTSMACPHVSGVAALLVSYYGRPGFTNQMLTERLLNSATYKVPGSMPVGKLVDAHAAFAYGEDVDVDSVTELVVEGKSNNLEMSWKASKDSNNKPAYGYMIFYGENQAAVEAATPAKFDNVEYVTHIPDVSTAKDVNYTLIGLDFSSTYYCKVLAYSYGLCYSSASEVKMAVTLTNNAPEINISAEGVVEVMTSEIKEIPVTFSDPDGHQVEYGYTAGSAADTFVPNPQGGYNIRIEAKNAEPGTYTAKISAKDVPGDSKNSVKTTTAEFKYTIMANSDPVKLKEIEDINLAGKGKDFTIDMTEYVNDPDGEALGYEFKIADAKILHMQKKGQKISGVALALGTTDVEIKAFDGRNRSVTFNFKVIVGESAAAAVTVPQSVITDVLTIDADTAATAQVRIYNQTGKVIYEKTLPVGGDDPTNVDMSSFPPGIYVVSVVVGGKEYRNTVVKI